MSKISLKNGWTKIANNLMEELYTRDFTGSDIAVILCIARLSYGYGGLDETIQPISVSAIAREIKRHRSTVSSSMTKLVLRGVIYATDCGRWGINMRANEWLTPPLEEGDERGNRVTNEATQSDEPDNTPPTNEATQSDE